MAQVLWVYMQTDTNCPHLLSAHADAYSKNDNDFRVCGCGIASASPLYIYIYSIYECVIFKQFMFFMLNL
jgi:hypothetical protein